MSLHISEAFCFQQYVNIYISQIGEDGYTTRLYFLSEFDCYRKVYLASIPVLTLTKGVLY